MGFFRVSFLVIVSVLLFISLFATSVLFTVSSSLEYKNVQAQISPIIANLTSGNIAGLLPPGVQITGANNVNFTNELNQAQQMLKNHCIGQENYTFSVNGQTFSVPCSLANESSDTIVQNATEQFFEQSYYAHYDCSFFDCMKTTPLAMISQQAQQYWRTKFYYSLLVSFVLALILFILFTNKFNFPILLGALMIVSVIPLLRLEKIAEIYLGNSADIFFKVFFNQSHFVFWSFVIPGLVVLCGGIGLRIWNTKTVKNAVRKSDEKERVAMRKK